MQKLTKNSHLLWLSLLIICSAGAYFAGLQLGSRKVPELVLSQKSDMPLAPSSRPQDKSATQAARKESVAKLAPGQNIKHELKARGLEKIVRYRSTLDSSLLSVRPLSESAGEWKEDLVVGFDEGTEGTEDPTQTRPLQLCRATHTATTTAYYFYSLLKDCGGSGEAIASEKAAPRLRQQKPSPLHIGLYHCKGARSGVHYVSLNQFCEEEGDQIQEVLGYVRAAKIVAPDETAL